MIAPIVREAMDTIYPSNLATCSAEGVPNLTILSQVWYVDERHIALSHQYFNKSKANVAANPHAVVRITGNDARMWELRVRYLRMETSGDTFDQMKLKLEAIASYMGMTDVFLLKGADIYEVLRVRECTEHWKAGKWA